jgi:glycosyltransferase involved in cell wall biosynthesis
MDNIAETRQNNPEDKVNSMPFSLPLVSVIIVNYNYGRFLKQAVDSVFKQTYPNIECIIVDDASSDDSADVLAVISGQYPRVTILRRTDNGGQSLASKDGFEASSGEYVVFLDADDFLLPAFVETHIFVHLSLRIPVGFTSADMLQAVESRLVLGTIYGFSEYVRSGLGKKPGLMRRIDESASEVWRLRSPHASIETEVHLVEPGDIAGWCWAPTSGNCFRRDALKLFLNNERLGALRSCTDSYLLRGVGIMTGSVLIDRPLAVYRLHGTNAFSKQPHLYCMVHFEKDVPSDNDQLGRKMVIDHLITDAKLFVKKSHSPHHYMDSLKSLNDAWPPIASTVAGCQTYLAGKLVSNSTILAREVGIGNFSAWMIRLKVAPHVFVSTFLRCRMERRR